MRRFSAIMVLAVTVALTAAAAQQKKPAAQKAGGASAAPRAVSQATVQAFLKHVLGWDPGLSWTIKSVGPSQAPGVTEFVVDMKQGEKAGQIHGYVAPGNKEAIVPGQMFPFPGEPGAPRPPDSAINSFVRQMTGGANPSITWTIAEVKPQSVSNWTEVTMVIKAPQGQGVQKFWVTGDGLHALAGELSPFGADPYAEMRTKLEKEINGPSRGPANAAVTIVEFADLQCPACKSAHPIVQRLLNDEPKVRFVFQQFPLTQMHHWAFKAAEYGQCVYNENPQAFWKFVDEVYAAQEQITGIATGEQAEASKKAEPKLAALAFSAGVNGQFTAACASQPGVAGQVNKSVELGKQVQVTGTPTLFINGRRISNLGGLPYENLKKMVEYAAAGAGR
ncbi:MAG: DsbA family protein [Terriglobales bacterium]